MLPINKPLLSLTAGDLMSPATVVVPQEMSLPGVARLLSRARVTGAPVIDPEGRCIGVISATDFLRWAEHGRPPRPPRLALEEAFSGWEIADEDLPDEAVRRYMTADPVTAAPAVTIGELARVMLDAHIHRVIVVDRDQRPVGVVSSTDILAAVVRAEAVRRVAAGQPVPSAPRLREAPAR
jgi:CBS domain-containing protein